VLAGLYAYCSVNVQTGVESGWKDNKLCFILNEPRLKHMPVSAAQHGGTILLMYA
jgi:hypothetical protein